MSDITVTYKDETILTMDASGSKDLLTQGKYCEDDISITYVKPAAPSGTKQISITQNGTTTEDVAAYANVEITVNVQGGGGATINKITGSFTPSSTVSHFEVTGLDNPPIVVLVLIHDASNTALDGTVKCLGGMYAYGDSVILQTNSGGTGYGRDQNNSLIPTWLDNYTVYPDGELAPTATIIATETGFAFKCIAATNYWLKEGYTYDWVAYIYPTV